MLFRAAAWDRLTVVALCAGLFFLLSMFMLVDKRERLRALAQSKQQAREVAIRLGDERRNLQLEYAMKTGYDKVSTEADKLEMVRPQVGQGNFLYLPESQAGARLASHAISSGEAGDE